MLDIFQRIPNKILCYTIKALGNAFDLVCFLYWITVNFLGDTIGQIPLPQTSGWVADFIGVAIGMLILARVYYIVFKKQ